MGSFASLLKKKKNENESKKQKNALSPERKTKKNQLFFYVTRKNKALNLKAFHVPDYFYTATKSNKRAKKKKRPFHMDLFREKKCPSKFLEYLLRCFLAIAPTLRAYPDINLTQKKPLPTT